MNSGRRAPVVGPSLGERLRRAWLRHPLVAFVRHRGLVTFYRQLHAMVRAGLPLPTAFAQLVQYAPDPALRAGLAQVAAAVRGGASLADAMRQHAALFDDANVELIAFAEEAGQLEPILQRLIDHLDQVQRQRWQALVASLWPMYLLGALIFLGPLLGAAQAMKPGASVGGLYLGGLASSLGTAALVLAVVLGAPFLVAALAMEVGWDRFQRGLPLLGSPLRQLAASRLTLGLGLGSASGLEVIRCLRLAVKATGSPSIAQGLPRAEVLLRRGGTLTEAVGTLDLLDHTSLGSLAVAETTGTLDATLARMSVELEAASVRATRVLMAVVIVLAAGLVLLKLVSALVGTLLGPVKAYYDAVGGTGPDT
jgi:general secretion pathway protein F